MGSDPPSPISPIHPPSLSLITEQGRLQSVYDAISRPKRRRGAGGLPYDGAAAPEDDDDPHNSSSGAAAAAAAAGRPGGGAAPASVGRPDGSPSAIAGRIVLVVHLVEFGVGGARLPVVAFWLNECMLSARRSVQRNSEKNSWIESLLYM